MTGANLKVGSFFSKHDNYFSRIKQRSFKIFFNKFFITKISLNITIKITEKKNLIFYADGGFCVGFSCVRKETFFTQIGL